MLLLSVKVQTVATALNILIFLKNDATYFFNLNVSKLTPSQWSYESMSP